MCECNGIHTHSRYDVGAIISIFKNNGKEKVFHLISKDNNSCFGSTLKTRDGKSVD